MKVYLASSVWIDYVEFLKACLEKNAGIYVESIYCFDEFKYRSLSRGSLLYRMYLRLGMYIGYPILLFLRLLKLQKNDICIITSNTFYAPAIALCAKLIKGVTVVQLMYDLFPDAIEAIKGKELGIATNRLLSKITRLQLQRCNATVFLGEELRKYAEAKYGKAPMATVIEIGADESLHRDREVSIAPSDCINIHYGGQIGYMHDSGTLVAGIKACQHISNVHFSLSISGAQAAKVEKLLEGLSNCEVGPTVPSEQWRKDTLDFQVGLATLNEIGKNVCIPSKTYSMMAAYMAIIAICPRDSDLAHLVQASQCGWVVQVGDVDGFVNVIQEISNNPAKISVYRALARQAAVESYGLKKCSEKWRDLLGNLK